MHLPVKPVRLYDCEISLKVHKPKLIYECVTISQLTALLKTFNRHLRTKISAFCDVMQSTLTDIYQHFRGEYCLLLQVLG
jgi:hypothetical protein